MNTARYARFLALMLFLIFGIHASTASEVIYLDPDQDRWVVNNAQSIYALPGHDYANTLIILENAAAKITEIAPSLVNQLRFQLYSGQDYFYQQDGQELIIYSGTQRILSVPLNNEGRSEAYFRVGATGDFHAIRPHALEGYAVGTQPLVATPVAIYDEDSRLLATVMTDANGFYRYPVSAPGNYHVVVKDSGFERALAAVCYPQNQQAACHVTPFSTLTDHLIKHHGYGVSEARYAANSRLCGCTDCLDPFAQWAEYFAFSHTHDAPGFTMLTQEIERHRGLDGWLASQAVLPISGIKALQGTVKLASILPIRYGEVRLVTDTVTHPQMAMTDATGAWVIPLNLLDLSHLNPLRIEVDFTRGRISETFSTSLSAETLAAFAQSADQCAKSIEINVFTTLADRYQRATGADAVQTQLAIQRYFNMPGSIDLSDTRSVDPFYSRQLFFDDHTVSLKFDHVIAEVWRNSQLPRKAHLTWAVIEKDFAAVVFDGVKGVAAGWGVNFVAGHVLNAVGLTTHERKVEQHMEEINRRLSNIETAITRMESGLENIQSQISDLGKQLITEVQLQHFITRANTNLSNAATHRAYIKAAYNDLIYFSRYRETLSASEFLSLKTNWKRDNYTISRQITTIHDLYFTQGNGDNFFENLTQALIIQIQKSSNKNDSLALSYNLLQFHFLQAIDFYLSSIIVEANIANWNADLEGIDPNLNTIISNFDTWNTSAEMKAMPIKQKLDDAIDMFLMSVERLVVASADTRTHILGGSDMFPANIHAVFREADLIAKLFNPKKYDAALVVRVIGDPASFERYDRPLLSINASARDIKYWNINRQGIRRDYSVSPYIGWRFMQKNELAADILKIDPHIPVLDFVPDWGWRISEIRTIRVTKFKIDSIENNLNHYIRGSNAIDFNLKNYIENNSPLLSRDVSIKIDDLKDTQKDIANSINFGHVVIVARENPRLSASWRYNSHEPQQEYQINKVNNFCYDKVIGSMNTDNSKFIADQNIQANFFISDYLTSNQSCLAARDWRKSTHNEDRHNAVFRFKSGFFVLSEQNILNASEKVELSVKAEERFDNKFNNFNNAPFTPYTYVNWFVGFRDSGSNIGPSFLFGPRAENFFRFSNLSEFLSSRGRAECMVNNAIKSCNNYIFTENSRHSNSRSIRDSAGMPFGFFEIDLEMVHHFTLIGDRNFLGWNPVINVLNALNPHVDLEVKFHSIEMKLVP